MLNRLFLDIDLVSNYVLIDDLCNMNESEYII